MNYMVSVLKWRFRELRKLIRYRLIRRNKWKRIFVGESEDATWEILNQNNKVVLHYVPKDDYSDEDIKIELKEREFVDLIKFMIRIS